MDKRTKTPRQIMMERRKQRDAEAARNREGRRRDEATRVLRSRLSAPLASYAASRPFKTTMLLGDSINAFYTEIHRAKSINRKFNSLALYRSIKNVLAKSLTTGSTGWVVLSYIDRRNNRPRYVTIDPSYMRTYEKFLSRIEEIENEGNPEGSGQISDGNHDLQLSRFTIRYVSAIARGSSDFLLYNTELITSKTGHCARESFAKHGLDYKGSSSFDEIREFAEENGVIIYGNTFEILKDSNWQQREFFEIEDPAPLRKGVKKPKTLELTKLLNEDIKPYELVPLTELFKDIRMCEMEASPKLLYCEKSKHMDCVKLTDGSITLQDDLYISPALKIYRQTEKGYKQIFSPQELYKYQHPPSAFEKYFLVFDYETVVDFNQSNQMKPYSLSCYVFPKNDYNIKLIEKDVEQLMKSGECEKLKSFVGWDCTKKFADYLLKNQINKAYDLVSFNGSNFDNIILLRELLILNQTEEYKERLNISDIFYNGNQLINFKINGRHSTFDLAKYISGSLKSACENFKVPKEFCKKGFDHDKVQTLYDEGKLDELLKDPTCEFYKELVEYNNFDCISLAYIHLQFRDALCSIPIIRKDKMLENLETDYKTIGSLIYKIFSNHINRLGYHLPNLSYELYNDLQKSKVAGRVELFNGAQEIQETMASADICSAYPYEMAVNTNWFPVGFKTKHDLKKTIEENEVENGNYIRTSKWYKPPTAKSKQEDHTRIGFYYCSFNQKKLKTLNRANIFPEKIFNNSGLCEKNLWETENTLVDCLLPNVTIQRLRDAGVTVEINQERKGIVFQHKRKNIEIFEPILHFMRQKNQQDIYKQSGDKRYNACLREMNKLLMNSLSGKVTENLHVEKTQEVDFYKFTELEKKVVDGKLKSINAIDIVGDKVFATTTDFEINLIENQRPVYMAMLIYSYTQKTMSENLYDRFGLSKCVYTDTDACKVRYTDFVEWQKWATTQTVKHWEEVEQYDPRYKTHKLYEPGSKVFGSFENELDTDNNHSWFQGKKQYLISSNDRGYHPHMSFKGVNAKAIIIDVNNLPSFILVKQKKTKGILKNYYTITDSKAAYYYAQNNQQDSVGNNYNKLFSTIKKDNQAFLLCSSFNKNIKNSLSCDLSQEERLNKLQNTVSLRQTLKCVKG